MGVILNDADVFDHEPPLPRWQLGVDARIERIQTLNIIDSAIFAAKTEDEPQSVKRLQQLRKLVAN